MSTETQVATLQSVQEKVKERIQASFMDLLPQELFDAMVKKAVDDFTTKELPDLVKQAVRERLADAIKTELSGPEWQGKWLPNCRQVGSQMVEAIVRETAPELVQAMFGGMVQDIVSQIRNNGYRF